MGTRCGSIDPSVITYIMKKTGMTPDEMDNAMNKKSGLLGVSGVSNDAREVWAAADEGNARAKLAMEIMCQGAKKLIGSYTAEMNGLDVLVFTAGIGENDDRVRASICENFDALGIAVDPAKNDGCREMRDISADGAKVRAFVIPTNEEYAIATETLEAVQEAGLVK